MLTVIAFLVVILICVGLHELGHFLVAKVAGVRVDEFSVGFGPRVFSRTRGETRYSLRLLPLGGFVRMAGMLGLRGETDAGPRNFYRASIPKRLAISFAGIAMNFLLAITLFTAFYATPTASQILDGSPAQSAGLRSGDSIVSIAGHQISHGSQDVVASDAQAALDASQGNAQAVVYRSTDGVLHSATIKPALTILNTAPNNASCDPSRLPEGASYVTAINGAPVGTGNPQTLLAGAKTVSGYSVGGVNSPCPAERFTNAALLQGLEAGWKFGITLDYAGMPLTSSVGQSLQDIWNFVPATVQGITQISTTPGSGGIFGPNGLVGPIGIAQQAGDQVAQGPRAAVYFVGYISMALGFLNFLPIPFLDGGRILLVLIEAVRRRRLAPEREAAIYAVGAVLILMLMVYVTIGDVRRLINGGGHG